MSKPLTRDDVLSASQALPAFPRVIQQIVATLEDPDANLNLLVSHVEHDPALTGHILSMANKAGTRRYGNSNIDDVFTAISLMGLSRVREVAIMISIAEVFEERQPQTVQNFFWHHSVAVGVCCVELAHFSRAPVNVDTALIAGLLHDVGQLWLQRFEPLRFKQAIDDANLRNIDIVVAEREKFGVDHGEIGAWLANHWGLSPEIGVAISHHHKPEAASSAPLVAVAHVAEVLCTALALTKGIQGSVTDISSACCATLGLEWGDGSHQLFGRVEARNRQAAILFDH